MSRDNAIRASISLRITVYYRTLRMRSNYLSCRRPTAEGLKRSVKEVSVFSLVCITLVHFLVVERSARVST